MHFTIIIVTCIIIIVSIAILKSLTISESFAISPFSVYTDLSPDIVKLDIPTNFPELNELKLLLNYPWMKQAPGNLAITDTFSFAISNTKQIPLSILVPGAEKYAFILKKKNEIRNESIDDIISENKSIYVESPIHRQLLEILIVSCGFETSQLTITQDINNAYCQFVFRCLGTKQKDFDFIDFEKSLNIHKLKAYIPFIQTIGVDMSMYFDLVEEKFPIKTTLMFKHILLLNTPNISKDKLSIIIDTIGDLEETNYYTMHFEFHELTLLKLREINKYIQNRNSLPILEQFQNFTYTASKNVEGFYDASKKIFEITNTTIDEIPIRAIDTLILNKQIRHEENGKYTRIDLTTFKQIEEAPPQTDLEREPGCVGDPSIKIKALCESDFDAMGKPKKYKTIWDSPCVQNSDCPFYQSNRTYRNYRGGCNNGYCEMPIGTRLIGYRNYTGVPMCYGCPIDNPSCCDQQESPDLMFEFDFFERRE